MQDSLQNKIKVTVCFFSGNKRRQTKSFEKQSRSFCQISCSQRIILKYDNSEILNNKTNINNNETERFLNVFFCNIV